MGVKTKKESENKEAEDTKKHLNSAAMRAYSGQKKAANVIEDEQIAQLLPMVHKIAYQVTTYLKPPLSFEDLVSAGTVGLVKAARDFDPSYQTEFTTYAYIRIKGAVLDELRGWSFVPVNMNKQIRKARKISQRIIEKTGAAPDDSELAKELGVTIDQLYQIFESARAQHFVSIDGFGEDTPALGNFLASPKTTTPALQIEQAELIDNLARAIQELPQKQRRIILLYYQQHLTMKQVADVLEITESRVSQLHASAIFNLFIKLRHWEDGR